MACPCSITERTSSSNPARRQTPMDHCPGTVGCQWLGPAPKGSTAHVMYLLTVVRLPYCKDSGPGALTSSACQLHKGGNHG